MRRRVLLCLTLITLSACNGDTVVKPTASPGSPTNAISDATHTAIGFTSNPDFFFLPPMVGDPSGSPNWNAGAFNASLRPMVEICASAALTESTVATSPCTPLPPALAAAVDATSEQYQVNWKVPTSSTIFYRITVKVGSTTLGFADVETASNASQLKNVATGEFIPLSDGRTLPIKFRIERYALCSVPGVGPCTSGSGDIATAPLTVQTGTPTTNSDGISTAVGVTIPQQTGSTTSTPVTVTISSCPNLNPAVIDLPTFGDCVRVTTDPVLPRLTNPATVFICAVGINASLFAGLSESQEARVTLHRYDATGPNAGVTALPHTPACKPGTPGGALASAGPSLRGMLADVAHGQIKHAASQVIALLAPKPLYAAMFIDLGGGGFTEFFSDFQFALPSKMEIVDGTTGQSARVGATLHPAVVVKDLGGELVKNATVHFGSGDGALAVTTLSDGLASIPWTIGSGSNSLVAYGRGIAAADRNGPRGRPLEGPDLVVDPFQPIQPPFDDGGVTSEEPVGTGTVTFTATSRAPSILIYGPSLFSPTQPPSRPNSELTLATSAGMTVTVWDEETWRSKTSTQFAQYDAIVFGDLFVYGNCASSPAHFAAANDTKGTWSSVVNGPAVVIGTDPVFHQINQPQAVALMNNALSYVVSDPNARGMYVSLSCAYHLASPTVATPVDFLSGIGYFAVIGHEGIGEDVTIQNSAHPVMAGLSNAGLSNWHESGHEAFPALDSYPIGWQSLAKINKPTTGDALTYIIARGTPTP